jgi:hypothetical protein
LVRLQAPVPSVLSDDELLMAITRDLRAIYSEVIRQPLPDELAAVVSRLELRISTSPRSGPHEAICHAGTTIVAAQGCLAVA